MFILKLLHNCLPTFDNLRKRGIRVAGTCLMCNDLEETDVHLFLSCNSARAIWHGTNLGFRTYALDFTSIDQWLSHCILSSKDLEQNRMGFLQAIFTTLWSDWNHRNMVLHQGLTPNPIEVILISVSLMCRYQDAFSHMQKIRRSVQQTRQRLPHQDWQILIKVAASRNRRTKRYGFAFEATTMDGATIFRGAANSGWQSIYMVTQEAIVEAVFKAKHQDFSRILVLCNHKKLVQI